MFKFLQILRSFSKKERLVFMATFVVFLSASILSAIKIIEAGTELAAISSGEYTEGIIGQPIFINPILSEANGPDSDINQLVFASLKDLMDSYEISSDNKIFTVRIKGDFKWQDGQPITTDDIIFTIEAIQDPDVNSPLYSNWKGVKTERVSERELKLTIPYPYVYFENILSGLRPAPKHIFSNIPFTHIKLSSYNLEPVGSGKFQFLGIEKKRDGFITKISLKRNDTLPDSKPHLDKFNFNFYSDESVLIKAFNQGEINGFSLSDPKEISEIYAPHQIFELNMPRYYAVFLNHFNNPLLKNSTLKTTLNYATDKEKIIKDIFNNYATSVKGPVFFNNKTSLSGEFSTDKANQILDSAGWTLNSDGVRERQDDKLSDEAEKLEFTLTVYPNKFLTETAKILQSDWAKIGVKINLDIPQSENFEEKIITPRNYDMLIFGNIYGQNMDLFSFWHSSQKFHPGLNLSLYENKNADYLIELIRTDFNTQKRAEEMEKLESTIESDQPAIFLYSPSYVYITAKSLKGFGEKNISLPNDRFSNIQNWYVKTARVLK